MILVDIIAVILALIEISARIFIGVCLIFFVLKLVSNRKGDTNEKQS